MSEVVLLVLSRSASGLVQATIRDVRVDESGKEVVAASSLYGNSDGDYMVLHMTTLPGHSLLGGRLPVKGMIAGHKSKSGILFLELDGQNVAMYRATTDQYQHMLRDLRIMGHFYHALKAQNGLESSLESFIGWGHQRITDPIRVASFYRYRETYYERCLSTVRRDANRGLNSAELPCVTSINADTYALEDERRTVLSWQPELARRTGAIEGRLKPVAVHLRHWATLAAAASARLSTGSSRRRTISPLDRALKSGTPLLDFQSLKNYRIMVPKVRASIRKCVQIVQDGGSKLKALAVEIDLVSRTIDSGLQS